MKDKDLVKISEKNLPKKKKKSTEQIFPHEMVISALAFLCVSRRSVDKSGEHVPSSMAPARLVDVLYTTDDV